MTTLQAPLPTRAPAATASVPDAAPSSAPCVAARGIVKRFPVRRSVGEMLRRPFARPEHVVLREISLEVRSGELFGLLGLNGAGKTTFLRIVAGLVHSDGGHVSVLGHDVATDPGAVRRVLSVVTADERSLHWRLSAHENLRLFAGLYAMDAARTTTRTAEVLEAVGLADTGRKMVGAFSSGMRQRLLVARALLPRPRVLLLDEPTRSLDPLTAHAFRRMLREVVIGGYGATVLMATHNTEEAFAYCDRVAVLHRGAIAALGSAAAIAGGFVRDRYVVRTGAADDSVFPTLQRTSGVAQVERLHGEAGAFSCEITGGDDGAARVLRTLVEAGVAVSRFERMPVALSDLIEGIAAAHDAGAARREATHA